MNPLELMRAQVRTLYEVNTDGSLQRVPDLTIPENEWENAPRFFMGRTAFGNVWHFHRDLSAELVRELDALCRSEPPLQVGQEPTLARQVRDLLGTGEEWRGPAYLLPPQNHVAQAIEITAERADLLLPHFPGTAQRARAGQTGPMTAVIQHGQAVAVCSCVRLSRSASGQGAAEAGVFTLEDWRGHGYAAHVTALWANLLHTRGMLPLYSTGWDNTASQAVAGKLNAKLYGEDWSVQ